MFRRIVPALIAALAATSVVVSGAAPASAAQCEFTAASGIQICSEANQVLQSYKGYSYAKTSSYVFTVKRTDSTVRITSVKVIIGGSSSCRAPSSLPGCRVFHVTQKINRASTGTTTQVPSYANKWGFVTGPGNFQLAHVEVTWCHGTRCSTYVAANVGVGYVM